MGYSERNNFDTFIDELEDLLNLLQEYKMNINRDLKLPEGINYNNYKIEKKFSNITLEREEALTLTSILYELTDQGYYSCEIIVKPAKDSIGLEFLLQSLKWDQIIDKIPWDSIKDVAGDTLKQIVIRSSIGILEKTGKKIWNLFKRKK